MDGISDLTLTTVATAPSPANSGTSLVVAAGAGANFPAAPFDVLAWPTGANPTRSNAEMMRCTLVATDTLTLTRNAYGYGAQSIAVGWQIAVPWDVNIVNQLIGDSKVAQAMGAY